MSGKLLESQLPGVQSFGLQTNKPAILNGPVTINNVVSFGGIVQGATQALSAATTPLTVTPVATTLTLTPTQAQTLNFAAAVGAGQYLYLEVITSGTSSFVITFGTNTKSQGTLTTGTVTAKTFVVSFASDGLGQWVEQSRTTAM